MIDASSPPIVTAVPPLDASSTELAQIWRNIFPWGDLNAQGPPERWLTLGKDIMPSLSVLAVGAGAAGPKLLKSDASGRLAATATGDTVDRLQQPTAQGAQNFFVGDQTLFPVGSDIMIFNANGPFRYEVSNWNIDGTIRVSPPAFTNHIRGEFVLGLSVVTTRSASRVRATGVWGIAAPQANQLVDAGVAGLPVTFPLEILRIQFCFASAMSTQIQVFLGDSLPTFTTPIAIVNTAGAGQLAFTEQFLHTIKVWELIPNGGALHVWINAQHVGDISSGCIFADEWLG